MDFKFIDIGTSDFDTRVNDIIGDDKILLVEPLFYYLKNLSSGKGIFKAPFAISNICGFGKMFYVKPEVIKSEGLPLWVRGCNSLDKKHPTVLRILKELGKSENLISQEEVRILSFRKLLEVYEINYIDSIKIDAEGHDAVILSDVYRSIKNGLSIREIRFEYIKEFAGVKDPLNCTKDLDRQMRLFKELGYNNKVWTGDGYSLTKGRRKASMIFNGALQVAL